MAAPKFFRVVDGPINIRLAADTDAPKVGGQLQTGQQVEVVIDSRTVSDGYVWWQHSLGWSAECTENGAGTFMKEIVVETDKAKGTAVVNTTESPTITLPTGTKIDRPILFQQSPVLIDQTAWVQYFGNTWFAYNLSTDRVPSRQTMYFYCQSLHGGIDYGNQTPGVPIVAGISGVVDKVEKSARSYSPGSVRVKVGDFTVIYGHMGNVTAPNKGQQVTPDMQLGVIEKSQCHLHLEVRYKETWIINPLLFMPAAMSTAFINKFSKFNKHFYSDVVWTQWQTPFDQPVLRLSSTDKAVIIGPRAARG